MATKIITKYISILPIMYTDAYFRNHICNVAIFQLHATVKILAIEMWAVALLSLVQAGLL